MRHTSIERDTAINLAVELWRDKFDNGDNENLTATANSIYKWLTQPVQIRISYNPPVDQTTGKPTGSPGGEDMVALKDTEKIELTVTAEDAKLQPTMAGADVTYTSADTNIGTIVTDADNRTWFVAGVPGSTVITADWPDSPSGDIQGTLAVDVTSGNATSIQVQAGAPVAQ